VNAKPMFQRLKEAIENLLYPELRPHGRDDRDRLLERSSKTPLDVIEWAGTLAALVFVVTLTRYNITGLVDRIAVPLLNVLFATLPLGVTVGPLLVRRTRRGAALTIPLNVRTDSDP
jgi:hypothetical protein